MTRSMFILISIFAAAACVGEPPTDTAGGGGGGSGGGGGGGDGDGSGDGTGGGSGSGGGGGGDTTMTATRFLEEINMRFCDEAFTCKASFPTDAGVTFDDIFGATSSACYQLAAADIPPAQVESQIAAGKIEFNAADASACVAGITFGTCTELWTTGPTLPAACATALVGKVADGGACVTHFDCTNLSSYCNETSNTCTPDSTGARTLSSADRAWHAQILELLVIAT